MPTEAEWERAARGGVENQLYPWGDTPPQSLPDYETRWKKGPEPVGRYSPNAFGLYDICENVHEWCSDWYEAGYYAISPERNPAGPERGDRRASRGGPGGITSRPAGARPAPASRRNFTMPITDSAWRVVCSAGPSTALRAGSAGLSRGRLALARYRSAGGHPASARCFQASMLLHQEPTSTQQYQNSGMFSKFNSGPSPFPPASGRTC